MAENCEKNGCNSLDALTGRVSELERRNGEDHRQMREGIHDLEIKFAEQKGQLSAIMSTVTETKMDSKNILERLNTFTAKVDKVDDLEREAKRLDGEVDKINGKAGETWEHVKKQAVGWGVALILAIIAAALGLSKFL